MATTDPNTEIEFVYVPFEEQFEIEDSHPKRPAEPTGAPIPVSITDGNVNFSGGGPDFHYVFGKSFSGWTYLPAIPVDFELSSDDDATLSLHEMKLKSTLNNPARGQVFVAEEGWYQVSASVSSIGGPFFLSGVPQIYERKGIPVEPPVTIPPLPPECGCDCNEGTQAKNGSVSFSQSFGRISHCEGFSSGAIRINERNFSGRLFSPKCLYFLHPLTRKVLSFDALAQSATIVDDRGSEYTYNSGKPSGKYIWGESEIRFENGNVIERFSDRSEIFYDANGNPASIKSSNGTLLSLSRLGLELIRDGKNNIRQIWSKTDGLLDVVADKNNLGFKILWYKPADIVGKDAQSGLYTTSSSASAIKEFIFSITLNEEQTAAASFILTEKRGLQFTFISEWSYVASTQSWSFSKGVGGEKLLSIKTKTPGGNDTFTIAETQTKGDSQAILSEEIYSDNGDGEMLIGTSRGGVVQSTEVRVQSGNGKGKIASSTNREGQTTSCTYDAFNRILSETTTNGFAGKEEKIEYTYSTPASGAFADPRPIQTVRKIGNTVFSTETFSETPATATTGKIETETLTASGTTLTTIRRYYPISATIQSGRLFREERPDGTASEYVYSNVSIPSNVDVSSDLSFTETQTEGVIVNGAFEIVSGKSTRILRTYDSLGNIVREENFVHNGTAFVAISWVEKTYSPTHKVIATAYSDGRTSSADYICPGPVWTIDEEGIRTDFVYDSTKTLVLQTRQSPHGNLTTSFA